MRTGRPTQDPKIKSVRVRLNETMVSQLTEKSRKEDKPVSQIIREFIAKGLAE